MEARQIFEIVMYALFCIGVGWLIGARRTKAKLTWCGRLSVIFSDGYELMTSAGNEDQRYEVRLNAWVMKFVMKNARGRIIPPFIIFKGAGERLPFTMEYYADGSIEILLSERVMAHPNNPTHIYFQVTDQSGNYKYTQIYLTAPE